MLRRFIKDESGIAMGLAVIVVVIVGVMGAGLLVFVRNDLEAVVEVNSGQQAFDAADAGAQAAKRELLSDACPQSYDGQEAGAEDPANSCADVEESEWSYETVSDENVETPEEEADYVGRELDFDEKQIDVSIRHLPFHEDDGDCDNEALPEPVVDPEQHPDCAPEEQEGEGDEREFFKVESLGESGNGDARRRVEAIYHTTNLDVPKAYYSPGTITLNGGPCIDGVSVFSLESIEVSGGGGGCPGEDGGNITGEDRDYSDWQNSYNSTAREDASGDPVEDAGFAAVDNVEVGEDDELGSRDFDGSSSPRFVEDPGDSQDSDEITFPFDYESQEGQADEDRMTFLKEEAMQQETETGEDTYRPNSDDITDWPDNADDNTVVYIDAGGGESVRWQISNVGGGSECSEANALKGTLVVDGASLTGSGNKRPFSGVTIVRGGNFDIGGNFCWDGFVSADEGIELGGTPDPFVSQEVQNRPGFYGVETWSWRELYE